jgi:hypothetical protein
MITDEDGIISRRRGARIQESIISADRLAASRHAGEVMWRGRWLMDDSDIQLTTFYMLNNSVT